MIRHHWTLCCSCCLRKRMKADNPGRVTAISWHQSPKGPFSTLIIYEMLPPSGFIGKKWWRRRRKIDIKGMLCGPSGEGKIDRKDQKLWMGLPGHVLECLEQ